MKSVVIQSPVKGVWRFMNPPGHHPDAKDFVAVNSKGFPYHPYNFVFHVFYRLKVENTFAWGKDIFSPFSGTVIEVSINKDDRRDLNIFRDLIKGLVITPKNKDKDISYFLGNYIIIKSFEGVFALLAHLKKGSILVKEGQNVESGELIAKVGNSGNTIQPHLHFQLMSENDPGKSVPVPFLLKSYKFNNEENIVGLPDNYETFTV